jgi:hypothetical protein
MDVLPLVLALSPQYQAKELIKLAKALADASSNNGLALTQELYDGVSPAQVDGYRLVASAWCEKGPAVRVPPSLSFPLRTLPPIAVRSCAGGPNSRGAGHERRR